ncbi:CAT RNA binding domain-containing protein [Weissella cibaria]|uniref:CAT RNA binding domain-containing protein n=1 Tax=Weissella cibaria TaxID=137591 RepID=UPI001E40E68D|nr:CAT RNA binding domain-containing protein [Weissella cibaria]
MLIKKIFNNNVLLAEDKQQDIVVIGRGIGFQNKRGDAVEEALIDTRYLPQDEHWGRTFNDLASEISPLVIEMASNILRHAEAQLHTTFNTYLLVSLADHISYAIEKAKQQIVGITTYYGKPVIIIRWNIKLGSGPSRRFLNKPAWRYLMMRRGSLH